MRLRRSIGTREAIFAHGRAGFADIDFADRSSRLNFRRDVGKGNSRFK
jgi:hypothetical protein